MDLGWRRGRRLPSCPPFEVRHRPYVQNPREGHVYIPPSTPKGLANGSHPSSEEREELPRSVLQQQRGDCEETPKREVMALFDSALADQSKQDTFEDSCSAQRLAFV